MLSLAKGQVSTQHCSSPRQLPNSDLWQHSAESFSARRRPKLCVSATHDQLEKGKSRVGCNKNVESQAEPAGREDEYRMGLVNLRLRMKFGWVGCNGAVLLSSSASLRREKGGDQGPSGLQLTGAD